jgi:predicted TPR repeat methyltransferase
MKLKRPSRTRQAKPRPAKVGIDKALALAIRSHRNGQAAAALELYSRILAVHPDHPDALHYLGVLCHQLGKSADAVTLIRKAIAIDPQYADAYNNLGNVLKEQGQLEAALTAYRQTIALRPNHADAHNNLGTVLNAQGHLDEAVAAYEKAIALQAKHADAYLNLGNVYKRQGKVDATIQAYLKTISLRRYHSDAYRNLGAALYCEGRMAEASTVYRKWLSYEPKHPVALHMLAACSGENVPLRASNQYIQAIFNRFAASFDSQLQKLDYRAPALVAAVVARELPPPPQQCVVLDAGCGTGLCGPLLRPYARRLVGVDLSPGMLEKARERGVYDELARAELTEYMSGCLAAYDVIVSADVLVYFGELGPAFSAAATALRPGGRFIFSVERAADDGDGFHINPHGRYSHTEAYLRRTLEAARLAVRSVDAVVLRQERKEPVHGLLVLACKP